MVTDLLKTHYSITTDFNRFSINICKTQTQRINCKGWCVWSVGYLDGQWGEVVTTDNSHAASVML